MKQITLENSMVAAQPVQEICDIALKLDIEYLKLALEEMRESQRISEAQLISNNNINSALMTLKLNEAKLLQLEVIIKLGENAQKILELSTELQGMQIGTLRKIFE